MSGKQKVERETQNRVDENGDEHVVDVEKWISFEKDRHFESCKKFVHSFHHFFFIPRTVSVSSINLSIDMIFFFIFALFLNFF